MGIIKYLGDACYHSQQLSSGSLKKSLRVRREQKMGPKTGNLLIYQIGNTNFNLYPWCIDHVNNLNVTLNYFPAFNLSKSLSDKTPVLNLFIPA